MTDLALIQPATPTRSQWVEMVQPCADLASMIADTDFVPDAFRNKPAAIAACFMYGAEIGIGPMQSLAKIDIVKGRPAPRAELGRALLLGAGHSMWTVDQNNTKCTVAGHRRGEPNRVMSVTWTMDDFKKAGISNGNYQKYPRQMLYARASIELVRQVAPDALGGITLFAEEADDTEPATANAPVTSAGEPIKATTTRRRTPPAAPALAPAPAQDSTPTPNVDPGLPPLPGDEPTDPNAITADQIKKMMASFNDLGIKERNDRLSFISAAARTVESSKDLTIDEASRVIDALVRVNAGELTMVWNEDGSISIGAVEASD